MSRFKDIVVCLHSPYERYHLLNTSALAAITRYDESNQNSKFLPTTSGHFSAFTHVFLKSPIPANSLTTKKLALKEYRISRGEKLGGDFNFRISSQTFAPARKQLRRWQFSPLVHTIDIRDIERKFFFFGTLNFLSGDLILRGFYYWGNEPGGLLVITRNIPQVKNRRMPSKSNDDISP